MTTVKIEFHVAFRELFNEEWRNIVFYGGRGGGKSFHVADALLLRGRAKRLRIVCGREIQKTIKDSVHKLLADRIEAHGFDDWEVLDTVIRNKVTGSEFIFTGLWRNPEGIKSLEGADIAWIEEAQSISEDTLKILVPTIRKAGSQLIFIYNRKYELDPVHVRYVINKPPRTFVRKINFDTLQAAGMLPQELIEEMEQDKKDPETFAHVWLGEPIAQDENSIISRTQVLEAMDREVENDGQYICGVDVARMGSDRTVFWMRKGLKSLRPEIHQHKRTTEVCDLLEKYLDFKKTTTVKVDDTGVGCITEGTKVLTDEGWLYPGQLRPGVIIYSKNNGKVDKQKLISIREKQSEILRSGDYKFAWSHLVPHRTRLNNRIKLTTWKDALDKKQIIFDSDFDYIGERIDFELPEQSITMPNGGKKQIHPPKHISAEIFAEYLGWYVSEGSFERKQNALKITQNKNQYYNRIVELSSLFGKVQVKKNGNSFDICVFNKPLYEWIKTNCYSGGYGFKYKTVPRWVANNGRDAINSFLDAFRDGDGYMHKGSRHYVTSSVNLTDDLTELIVKVGKKSGCYRKSLAGSTFEIEGRTATRTCDNYVVFETKDNKRGNHYGIKPKDVQQTTGKVYSLIITGESRLMFTKVDGTKPIWTHNGGVTDEMIKRGYNVIPINFGGEPKDKDKYPNWISEAWFNMRDIMPKIQLPYDPDLLMELTTRLWKQDNKGKRRIQSKDDYKKLGYKSPDLADACIICYSDDFKPSFDEMFSF